MNTHDGVFFFFICFTFKDMTKPLLEIIFRPVDGIWQDAEGHVLADVLASYDIIVDDRTQFARLYDYERMICFFFRSYAGKVTLTLWRIHRL